MAYCKERRGGKGLTKGEKKMRDGGNGETRVIEISRGEVKEERK